MKGKAGTPIRKYATDQTSVLLRRMAFQASRTSQLKDADAVQMRTPFTTRVSRAPNWRLDRGLTLSFWSVMIEIFPRRSGRGLH